MHDSSTVPIELPDKLYFKIGEVSRLTDLPPYVLRFWETEFKKIQPKRTASGQRLYRRQDVELLLKIKHLLYDKKFTIQGAIKHLRGGSAKSKGAFSAQVIAEIQKELKEIRKLLA